MKKNILIISGLVVSFCLGFLFKAIVADYFGGDLQIRALAAERAAGNTVREKKVIGVGGIFFKSQNPEKLKEWYKTHLGFEITEFGTSFEWQEGTDPARKGSLQWAPFSANTKYFAPSTKDFMINYRVENLSDLVAQLKKEGVTFTDEIETYDYGKFVHLMDIDSNKIELYEPNYAHVPSQKSTTE